MKKAYTEPNLYYEDLELSTIITGDCGGQSGVIPAIVGSTKPDLSYMNRIEDWANVELIFANTLDCIAWTQSSVDFEWGWWFNEVGGVCNQEHYDNAPHDPGVTSIYGFDCYNSPVFTIINFASV
ncbi:MAG: hypothetical protein IKS90_05805 [Clostridia bacterium]|nr:hypothetical protein [Clostridia bacterium]